MTTRRPSRTGGGSRRNIDGKRVQGANCQNGSTAKSEEHVRGFHLSLNTLLILVPIAILFEHFRPDAHTLIFFTACAAIISLAGLMGGRQSKSPIMPERESAACSTPRSTMRQSSSSPLLPCAPDRSTSSRRRWPVRSSAIAFSFSVHHFSPEGFVTRISTSIRSPHARRLRCCWCRRSP